MRIARWSSQEGKEGAKAVPIAAVFQKVQEVKPACASELQGGGLGEATGLGSCQSRMQRGTCRRGGSLGVSQKRKLSLAVDK